MDYAKILSGWQKSKPITHSGQRVFFARDGRRAAAYARPRLLHQVEPICPANLARGSKRSQLRCLFLAVVSGDGKAYFSTNRKSRLARNSQSNGRSSDPG
jgi:hypothetical protein